MPLESQWYRAHDFVKVPLVKAIIKANNIDIICLSETFLDSTIPRNDERLRVTGYSMIRADHTSNTKEELLAYIIKSIYCLLEKLIFVN